MDTLRTQAHHFEQTIGRRLAPHQPRLTRLSVDLLRLSLGLVFLLFGLLKFVPGLSPAEGLATATLQALTFGLVPAGLGLLLVAMLETAIGVILLTGRQLRLGLLLLGGAMIGVLSPLVLFPAELFAGPILAPTLEGQYVIKDLVLLAAALVIAVKELARPPAPRTAEHAQPLQPAPGHIVRFDLDTGQTQRG